MNNTMVAAKAPNNPNKLKNGSARKLNDIVSGDAGDGRVPTRGTPTLLRVLARDTPFWFLAGCGMNKSASITSNAVVARTIKGAMRPQSAAETVNVNDIEKSLLVYQSASDIL